MKQIAFILSILALLASPIGSACAKERKVTLTLWELSVSEPLMKNLINKFEEQNPGVKVNLQQLTWEYGLDKFIISLVAHNEPDICELGTTWISKFASSDVLLDITDKISDLKEKYFLWDSANYNGKTYGIPWLAGTRILFYNKDLFSASGLDPEAPPKTWAQLLNAAKAIHSPRNNIWGFSIYTGEPESPWQEFLPFVWSGGGAVLSEDSKKCLLDSRPVWLALEFYKEISRYSLIERQSQVNELFAEGKVGMQISGSWNLRLIPRLNPQLNFGVSLMPRPQMDETIPSAFAGGELLAITKNSRHPKEALELIRFLTGKENVMEVVRQQQNIVPARKEALREPYYDQYPEQKVFLEQLNTALGPPNNPKWNEIQEHVTRLVEEVIMRDAPPQSAAKAAAFAIDSILEETVEKGKISDKKIPLLIGAICLTIMLLAYALSRILVKIKWNGRPRYITKPKKRDLLPFLYLSPWLTLFIIFSLYPLLYSIIISFAKYDILASNFSLVGFKNYQLALCDRNFQRALWHTLVFAVGTVPFTVGLSLLCAILINRKIPLKQLYQAGLFLPVTTSVVVIATVFTYIYSPKGLANSILDYLGIIHPQSSWLNSPFARFGISVPLLSIMVMNIWASFGYYTILFLAGLQTIPEKLYEMANLDGAGEWHKFKHITYPQLKNIILLVVVINTIYSLQVFPEIFTMTMGGPLGSTSTAVYYLYEMGFHKFDVGMASSIAYILSIIIIVFSLFQIKLLRQEDKTEE